MKNRSPKIAVCIPTNNNSSEFSIGYTLLSLIQQTTHDFRIYVRDEGECEIFKDRQVRQIWNLLSYYGIETIYRRSTNRKGIGYARWELYSNIEEETYILCVDDDMILRPNSVEIMLQHIEKDEGIGFVQGAKCEIDPQRTYWNDINQLNKTEQSSKPQQIWFGDTALLLLRTISMKKYVDWDIILKFQIEGLSGEDVALTLMIANENSGLGVPEALGWHMSPKITRWLWEAPSDLLQLTLLKNKVNKNVLLKALPHLAEYINE